MKIKNGIVFKDRVCRYSSANVNDGVITPLYIMLLLFQDHPSSSLDLECVEKGILADLFPPAAYSASSAIGEPPPPVVDPPSSSAGTTSDELVPGSSTVVGEHPETMGREGIRADFEGKL